MIIKLSEHLTLDECVDSHVAEERGLDNTPPAEAIEALKALAKFCFEPLRIEFGAPIAITSGFRSPALNRTVKGALDSQHMRGEALDMICADNLRLFEIAKEQANFDQLIYERGDDKCPAWVHISYSFKGANRGEILRRYNGDPAYHIWDKDKERWG